MPKITEARIRDAKYNGKPKHLRDSSLPGFFVAVNKKTKSYKIQADLIDSPVVKEWRFYGYSCST